MTTETKSSLPSPRKVVTYALGEDPNCGAVFLYGNPSSSNIAIFCAGFADDHEIGQVFCSRLAEENGALVGLTCLPGYDDRPDKKWQTHKAAGYTFDEMAGAIREAVKIVRAESTHEKAKLTGIFHDWGVFPGMLWANRSLADESADSPDEIVLFDVLFGSHPDHKKDMPTFEKRSFFSRFVTFYYRLILASAFALQRYLSKYLAAGVFMAGFLPLIVIPIGPTMEIDAQVRAAQEKPIDLFRMIYMGYPYFEMFKNMYNGSWKALHEQAALPKDLNKTPVLYLYGTEKRVMFHPDSTLYVLQREAKENRSRSSAIAVEDAGHYLYIQQADLCLNEVSKFMSK